MAKSLVETAGLLLKGPLDTSTFYRWHNRQSKSPISRHSQYLDKLSPKPNISTFKMKYAFTLLVLTGAVFAAPVAESQEYAIRGVKHLIRTKGSDYAIRSDKGDYAIRSTDKDYAIRSENSDYAIRSTDKDYAIRSEKGD
ncbi:hypothetical protein F5B18DRAFT_602777, partial [Nemania serpens]